MRRARISTEIFICLSNDKPFLLSPIPRLREKQNDDEAVNYQISIVPNYRNILNSIIQSKKNNKLFYFAALFLYCKDSDKFF